MEALQTSNAAVVQRSDGAAQIQPRPTRNGILGLALGIVLGIGLAFLWEALDTRVRSAEEIGERLGGLALLARVPTPSKKVRTEHRLVMLDEPTGMQAETFRMLRTNLDFASLDRDARTIMVTSAVEEEGKSTTIANLAIAMARAGQRVVLVDLDLRRPYAYVTYRIGDGADAEDVTSATFERALRYRDSFDPPWLIGIARRCIADALQRVDTPTGETPECNRELLALRYGADPTARQIGALLEPEDERREVAPTAAGWVTSSSWHVPNSAASGAVARAPEARGCGLPPSQTPSTTAARLSRLRVNAGGAATRFAVSGPRFAA
jgi:DNA-directed RNA polymerase specialized sigma24 family protein